ncbi:MAG TPA: ribosome assembly factor SBDS [Candidatus Nanoarchaeia archaeon]|nr:ribosome assembly factor SBDS [Candidatus Nanoarchaeia archaeon]
MAVVTARIKINDKHFETDVNLDEALKVKAGKGDIMATVVSPQIFYDLKKGLRASKADLIAAFGTDDAYQVATKIITLGEVQKNQEFRDAEHDARIKQLTTLIIRNAVDQNNRPYTEERIKRALHEVHYSITNKSAEEQLAQAIQKLQTVIPIKIETKRIKLVIPARFTGQAYGLLKEYKETEDWLANGDLSVIISIPSGMQLDFYDKLNSITHGSVQSHDIPKE